MNEDKTKVMSTSSPAPMRGGQSGGDNSGPTGSARTYPKGKNKMPDPKMFNPMNTGKNTYGFGGV